jgi:hypothetical protein
MFPRIKIIGEGEFQVIHPGGLTVDYKFLSHAEDCSVFAVPKNHIGAVKFCPICGHSFTSGSWQQINRSPA